MPDTLREHDTAYAWLPAGFEVHTATTNGTRLSAAVGGHGPTMVLLHGWPQTGRAWARVMPALAEHHTLVVPDLRGTGASDRPADGYAKRDQVEDVRGLLAALGRTGPVVVVGHDIGSMIAFAWAVHRPEDLAAVVLLDAYQPGVDLEQSMNVVTGGSWHFGFFMAPGIPEMLFAGHEQEFVETTFTALSASPTFTEEELAYYAHAYSGPDRLRGGFGHYRTLLDDGRENRAALESHRITVPILSVGGRNSVGDQTTEALRPHADNLTGLVAPTGHFVAEEAPDWLVRTVRTYLHDLGTVGTA
ncbi:alpha/beta fold hydrolase [Actinophytocola oryzae]|uniref:Pimeloyl-ACP methyl ester carboxylesterase n=1 Tax=Actinophytocola oryzae TaxID=502181 RepID=A0A4R7V593_9PSEU|nr:alpha/beta hydrolase [Actinophytocola oryzae]TDV43115.1 pimeloyl-ACP methyl ester carboxylesterase [Actinophytocola oryzae]